MGLIKGVLKSSLAVDGGVWSHGQPQIELLQCQELLQLIRHEERRSIRRGWGLMLLQGKTKFLDSTYQTVQSLDQVM